MKRMVKLPTGVWIDLDLIESFEYGVDGTTLYMASGRTHFVRDQTPTEVMYSLRESWRALADELGLEDGDK